MAESKKSYRIPYGLAQSYADMTIALQSKDGTVGKVLPMMVVSTYVCSFLGCLVCLTKTPVGTMSTLLQKILFVVLWVLLTIVLAQFDGTRRMNLQRVSTLLNYIPKSARVIYTRQNKNALGFYQVVGIESIDEDGLITHSDGTFGYWYRVVGSASILLFESDRDAIITRVDNFFRKWECDTEITFMTMKEAQKVLRQMANLKRRYDNIQNADADLRDLGEEQYHILEYVGKEFKSIHQYMFVKSKNKEALRIATTIIQSEIDNSAQMLRQCVPLNYTDVVDVLSQIYQKGVFENYGIKT